MKPVINLTIVKEPGLTKKEQEEIKKWSVYESKSIRIDLLSEEKK